MADDEAPDESTSPLTEEQRERFRRMRIGELMELEEAEGPEGDAARAYGAEITAGLRDGLRVHMRGITDAFKGFDTKQFGITSVLQQDDMLGVRDVLGSGGTVGLRDNFRVPALPEPVTAFQPQAARLDVEEWFDDEPDEQITIFGDMLEAQIRQHELLERLATQQEALVTNQKALLDLQRESSRGQERETQKNYRLTKWTVILAGASLAATIVGIVVTAG